MTQDQHDSATRARAIFATRLQTLSRLLDVAAQQWGEKGLDPEKLCGVRLAEDMFPLTHQVTFTCNQANDFVAWCAGDAVPRPDPAAMSFADLKAHVAATLGCLASAAPEITEARMAREKRVDLMHGMFMVLPGRDYVDEWLLPNFYFHLVTAYDLLRREGVQIGKADYMAHLHGRVQRT